MFFEHLLLNSLDTMLGGASDGKPESENLRGKQYHSAGETAARLAHGFRETKQPDATPRHWCAFSSIRAVASTNRIRYRKNKYSLSGNRKVCTPGPPKANDIDDKQ